MGNRMKKKDRRPLWAGDNFTETWNDEQELTGKLEWGQLPKKPNGNKADTSSTRVKAKHGWNKVQVHGREQDERRYKTSKELTKVSKSG